MLHSARRTMLPPRPKRAYRTVIYIFIVYKELWSGKLNWREIKEARLFAIHVASLVIFFFCSEICCADNNVIDHFCDAFGSADLAPVEK